MSQLSGRQNFTRKNFPDEGRQFLCQKCVNFIYQKSINCFRDILLYNSFTWSHKTDNGDGFFPDCPETFQFLRKLSRLSGNFPGCLKLSRLSRSFPENGDGFFSRLSGNFPDCLETFQTIQKLSREWRWFFFQTVRKLSSFSGNFPDCLETFQTARQLYRLPGNFPDCL